MLSAEEALDKLIKGNAAYRDTAHYSGDVGPSIRQSTLEEGQVPYAIVVTCSDSRVIPEVIFNAGIGELFVIRVAGNVVDPHQLGSIEYAADHLGCKLVVVLGHDHCGAVDAAMNHDPDGHIRSITSAILDAIGDEQDEARACELNALASAHLIEHDPFLHSLMKERDVKVVAALYHLDSGEVRFDLQD